MLEVFTYWDQTDTSPINKFKNHWIDQGYKLHIIGDDEVLSIVEEHFPQFIDRYSNISIPACRSDLARILGLYRYSGLYVDSHCGVVDKAKFDSLYDKLGGYKLILARQSSRVIKPGAPPQITNAIIFARRGYEVLLNVARSIISNLDRHHDREVEFGFMPYNILDLSGPVNIENCLFDAGKTHPKVHTKFNDEILVVNEEDLPVKRYKYPTKLTQSRHWSERQKTELLFGLGKVI